MTSQEIESGLRSIRKKMIFLLVLGILVALCDTVLRSFVSVDAQFWLGISEFIVLFIAMFLVGLPLMFSTCPRCYSNFFGVPPLVLFRWKCAKCKLPLLGPNNAT